jgi:hypothetical protein
MVTGQHVNAIIVIAVVTQNKIMHIFPYVFTLTGNLSYYQKSGIEAMLPTVHDEHRSRGSSAALCFFLMIIFLGTHFFPSSSSGKGKNVNLDSLSTALINEEVKEKIVYELSVTNEKLEVDF